MGVVTLVPPFDVNLLTCLWWSVNAANHYIVPKYKKLAKMVVVHVMESIQDESVFSSLNFFMNEL